MTSHKVYDYISMEHVDHSEKKLTRVIFDNGSILIGHLLMENQNIGDSLKTNIWNFRIEGKEATQIQGEKIEQLQIV